jgi:hypothetical protein
MPHDPRIEIFKIQLYRNSSGPKTFREFFRSKSGHYLGINPVPTTDAQILAIHGKKFIESIGIDRYKTDEKKGKGFTISVDHSQEPPKTQLNLLTASSAIDGLFTGGKYNAVRILGKVENATEFAKINRNNIVGDQFYFLIWTPLNHNEGVAIIQGYSESRITDIVRKHIEGYFTYHKEWSCFTEVYVPESYRESFTKGARFKKATFSSSWEVSEHDQETFADRKHHTLQVKIEIIDKSNSKAPVSLLNKIVAWLGKSQFKLGEEQTKALKEFDKIEAKMENGGKELGYNFENENDVTPSIILKEEKYINLDGSPNMIAIQEFCRNLLQEVAEELSPLNGIREEL